jgi:prophage DNA circulation protein
MAGLPSLPSEPKVPGLPGAAKAKKLSESLRPASFRRVAFGVVTTDLSAGRRTQLHEYPQRDKPYAEDIGRSARKLQFEAFVIGKDYVKQANDLLGAIEAGGPGSLVHPWFGTLTVNVSDDAHVVFDAALGCARFSLSFVESGDLSFPSPNKSSGARSRVAAGELSLASAKSFASKFSVAGFQDFVKAAAMGQLGDMLGVMSSGTVGSNTLGYANSLANTLSTAAGLLTDPSSLGLKLLGAFGLSGLTSTAAAWRNVIKGLSRIGRSSKIDSPSAPAPATGQMSVTASQTQVYKNASAVNALARQGMVVQAIGASSYVGTPADSGALVSHVEMTAARDAVIDLIDRELMSIDTDDDVYQALVEARAAVWADMTTRSRDSARLSTLTPAEVLPALVLAYDYYEDAMRDAEIVARNSVTHPGFVPAKPVQVLTR